MHDGNDDCSLAPDLVLMLSEKVHLKHSLNVGLPSIHKCLLQVKSHQESLLSSGGACPGSCAWLANPPLLPSSPQLCAFEHHQTEGSITNSTPLFTPTNDNDAVHLMDHV